MLKVYESIESYLETKKDLWSPSSIKTARSKLRTCVLSSDSLDPRELFKTFKERALTLYTIQTYLILSSGYEKWLMKTAKIESFLKENAFAFRGAYQEKTRFVTDEQFQEVLQSVQSTELYNLFILLGRCGLRISEARKAKWSDIAMGTLKVTGKGGKVRLVPILQEWLKEVRGSEMICGSCKGANYFIRRSPHTFHDFRAFYATTVANHPHLTMKDAQVLLGHSSITTTQRYVRVDFERVKKVMLNG